MEHVIQIAISIEDEKIVERVEETAEKQIIETLTDRVENVISEKRGWYGKSENDYTPLKDMVSEQITKILDEIRILFFLRQARFWRTSWQGARQERKYYKN